MRPEVYHDLPGISHSGLEVFRRRRREYEAVYVTKSQPPREPTESMVLGRLVDLLVLTPERWEESVAEPAPDLAPDGKKWLRRKGSDHERWWLDYVRACEGKLVVTAEQCEMARQMAESVHRNQRASELLALCPERQRVLTWDDSDTGLSCRAMLDASGQSCTVDLKTCRDVSPAGFARQAAALGYHRQAEWYSWGRHECEDRELPFVFICVSNTPPWEVGIYSFDSAAIALAGRQNHESLCALARCLDTGDFSEPHERVITELSLPRWAAIESDEYRITGE